MSLVRAALRISAIEALRDRTYFGGNVLDSEIGALLIDADGSLRTPQDQPFIGVYTDAATTKSVGAPLRAFLVNGDTDILFEAGITSAMTETDPATDESKIVGIALAPTDRAIEFYLDLVIRQIGDVLTDPDNEWSQLFMSFISATVAIERYRTSGDANGTRLAGQQLKLTATLIPDPVRGEELRPTSVMARFLAKAATIEDPVIRMQADLIAAQISGDDQPLKVVQRRYGITNEEAEAMLLTMPAGAEP